MSETLTESDCLEIVRQKLNTRDFELVNFKIESLGNISGFLGEYSTLEVNIVRKGENVKLRFFLKSIASATIQRKYTLDSGAIFKEQQMFKKIIPHVLKVEAAVINECVARCYLIRPLEFLVLEDLSAIGFEVLDHWESLSLDAVKLALTTIAKFHACFLILEERTSETVGATYRISADYEAELTEVFYSQREHGAKPMQASKKGVLSQIDYFGHSELNVDLEELKQFALESLDRFYEYVAPSKVFRNTICHGDLWSPNLMFRFEDGKPVQCRIIDFQSYRYSPPAQDVMSFLYLSTDRKFRRTHMSDMLEHYFQELKKTLQNHDINIDSVISYEEYTKSCKYFSRFAIAQAVVHFHLSMMPQEALAELFSRPNDFQKFAMVNRGEEVVKVCGSFPEYRHRLLESLLDLRDIL